MDIQTALKWGEALGAGTQAEEGGALTLVPMMLAQAELLERRGFFPISPFWQERLKLIDSIKPKRVVAQVGRRGIKTTTVCRVACASSQLDWPIPMGERGIYGVISVNKAHARRRVHTIASMLDALEIAYRPIDSGLALLDRPIDIQVYACSHRAVIGDTWIGMACDEMARWRDEDKSADPAREVIASAQPCMTTMRPYGAMEWWISSPWAEQGTHYEHVALGTNDEQVVVVAPTWEANPAISEADTRAEQPDELLWSREFAAIPMPRTMMGVLDSSMVEWLDAPPQLLPGDVLVAGADLALQSDSSTLVAAIKRGNRYLVHLVKEWRPERNVPLDLTATCTDIRDELKRIGCPFVAADQHYRARLREVLLDSGLAVVDAPLQVVETIVRLRDVLRERQLAIYCEPAMRKRLRAQIDGVQLVPTTNGLKVVHLRADGAHGDMVAALALATWQFAGATVPQPAKHTTHKERLVQKLQRERQAEQRRRGGGRWVRG